MNKKMIILTLTAVCSFSSQAALVNNAFTDHNENDLTWAMVDAGWQTKGYWSSSTDGVVHIVPGDNWGVGQVNSVTTESGGQLTFRFDWTPSASATDGALELDYQLIGWNAVGTPTNGNFFVGMNYNGKYVDTAGGKLEKIDLLSGTSGGTAGGNFATGYNAVGQADVTTHVEFTLDLSDDSSGLSDISDYEYIGFRFAIDSDNDAGNVGGKIENIHLGGVEVPVSRLASANLKEDVLSGEASRLTPWSFMWNPTGVTLGNESGYRHLVASGSYYQETGAPSGTDDYTNSRGEDLTAGNQLQVYNVPANNQWWLISGATEECSTDGINHYLIVGYTVQPEEEGIYKLRTVGGNGAPSELAVYVNNDLLDSRSYTSKLSGGYTIKTPYLSAGDTIYVAFAADSSYGRNERRWYGNIEISQLGNMTSFDAGYTIYKIRAGVDETSSYMVGSSWEGTVLRMEYDGTAVWTNKLSGYMNHDVWCADINGDDCDEVLTANADGTIYCMNGQTGELLWQFKTNSAPMHAVCTVHDSDGTPYVVCGGFDLSFYYLDTNGVPVKSLYSRSYSVANAWVDTTPTYDKLHMANFIRPLPMPDGSERLLVHGANSHVWGYATHLYEFEVLADQPVQIHSMSSDGAFPSAMRVVDPDGDGQYEVLFGQNSNHNGARVYRYDLADGFSGFPIKDAIAANSLPNDFGYRTPQPEIIETGSGFEVLTLYGNKIVVSPPNMDPDLSEVLICDVAFNDMWRDPLTGYIILASAQSGGSAVHIIDPSDPDWKSAFEGLTPPGKVESMLVNIESVKDRLEAFSAPGWERAPQNMYFCGYYEGSLGEQISDIQNNNDHMVFLKSFMPEREMTNWRYASETYLDNDVYRDRIDGRMNYSLTQQQAVDRISAEYAGNSGISYWAGHGNDPYMYQRSTSEQVIDADSKPSVQIWPEIYGSNAEFEWVLNDLFYPLGEHAKGKDAWIYFRSKAPMWFSVVHDPIWEGFLSGNYAESFVAAHEETGAKINDLSVPGRVGLWASGVVDQWGSRGVPDMVRFSGLRTHCDQRIPSHYLRYSIYNMALGARFINDHGVTWHEDYFEIIYDLLAKGALFVPKREEIVSFSPVHLSMKEPDESLIREVNSLKWNIFYDEEWEENNPRVFSRMNDTWPAAPVTEWDFSRYAAGVKDRTTHFVPSYPNGLVMITPPQDGEYVQTNAVRGRLDEKLHPLYRNIMQEFITDGTDYISADGSTTYSADSYCSTVSNAIATASKMLPVTVKGEVAWVCAQTDPYHLRLTLVDSGFLNPDERLAEVTFNTVTPVSITDVMDGTVFSVSGRQANIDIPLGTFRFIDIELSEPFFPDNGWGQFASANGLNGAAEADYDGDGESDLLEYAFGGDPTNSIIGTVAPGLEYGDGDLVRFYNWQVSHTNPGISYVVEWTDNLVSNVWKSSWDSTYSGSTSNEDYEEVEHRVYGGTNDHLFMRLQVTIP